MTTVQLERRDGNLFATVGDAAPVAVRVVWARPLTGRGSEVSLLDGKNNEVAFLTSLDELDGPSRTLAEEELTARYLMPRILRVPRASSSFGQRVVVVETDRGPRSFALKDPNRNVLRPTSDRLVFCDVLGNRYEISSLKALDEDSRRQVAKVL